MTSEPTTSTVATEQRLDALAEASASCSTASDSRAGPAESGEDLERVTAELLADPCHLLRRACQLADYGPPGATGGAATGRPSG